MPGGLPSCGGGLKPGRFKATGRGLGEINVKKRNKYLDIAACNRLSLIECRMHLKCIEKSVKNNEPPQIIRELKIYDEL